MNAADSNSGVDTIRFTVITNGTPILLGSPLEAWSEAVNIIGNGEAYTIIDGDNSTEILNVGNFTGTFNISDLTFRNAHTTSFGGVIDTGRSGQNWHFTNVTFENNHADVGGVIAARVSSGTGPRIYISYCTFEGNSSDSSGGVIYSIHSPIYVDHSTFNNNHADSSGGVFWIHGVPWWQTPEIKYSSFTNNYTDPPGNTSVAWILDSGDAEIQYNRFVGNSGTALGLGNDPARPPLDYQLQYNWWGCNAGVNNPGCDRTQSYNGAHLHFNPYLQLALEPDNTQIPPSTSTGLTTKMVRSDTSATMTDTAVNGLTATFTAGGLAGVSVDNASGIFSSGEIDNTFNCGVTFGSAYADVTLDNQTTVATIECLNNTAATITSDTGDPSVVGQGYPIGVSVVDTSGGSTPTGTVTVDDGDGNDCTATLAGGSGSCTLTSTSSGVKTVTATYNGDSTHATSSGTEAHTVNSADTTTTITADTPDPSIYGQAYTVDVTIAAVAPGAGTPTGNVDVDDGNGHTCVVTLSGGSGSCSLNNTPIGTNTLTAAYNGDGDFNTSSDTEDHTTIGPDLQASKSNNVGGAVDPLDPWRWTISITNNGGADAIFSNGDNVLEDDLPDNNISYGAVSMPVQDNLTNAADLTCSIVSNTIECIVTGAGPLTIGATSGRLDVEIKATPQTEGQFSNPRSSGICRVDPDGLITESDEGNNDCADAVSVKAMSNPVDNGGGIYEKCGWKVNVLPLAVPDGSKIKINCVPAKESPTNEGMETLGHMTDIKIMGPEKKGLHSFHPNLEVCFNFDTEDLRMAGGNASNFTIGAYPSGGSAWEMLATYLKQGWACAKTAHLSHFELFVADLPNTGFAPGVVSKLPRQPDGKTYSNTDMILDIPKLGVRTTIVGVPLTENGWDVTWLGNNAGYLNGTAFPTYAGNTVITAHVWDANNHPGPFASIKDLQYGDRVRIYAWGQVYTYEVRYNYLVYPGNLYSFKHEEYDWVTLLTCERYSQVNDSYRYRRVVRVVLVDVSPE
jgi:LPXTG-site transpeptidase (sortase) family protein